jgi:transposase
MQSGVTHVEVKALRRLGWSISAIAREFDLSRTTVYKELASPVPRTYGPRARIFQLNEAQLAFVQRRLAACAEIRGTDLHAEVRYQYGYEGSYPVFQRQLRLLRPAVVRDPEIRFETHPGEQTQADWAELGLWPLGREMVELSAMVAILGCSRTPALRFATDQTRPTSFERVARCLDDLGGVTRDILTDRESVFVIGQSSTGTAIFAPEWIDVCELLGVVPKACRPFRAKTKGKVERMIREVKESFLCWLTGQVLPQRPTLADYDDFGRRWVQEIVLGRRHRTTKRLVGEAWQEERALLSPIPERILASFGSSVIVAMPAQIVDLQLRRLGEHVEVRDLAEYEVGR